MSHAYRWPEIKREQCALIAVDQTWAQHPDAVDRDRLREVGRLAAAKRYATHGKSPEWKIRQAARNCVARIARTVGSRRGFKSRTGEYLGCTYDFARSYLEVRFLAGMTWDNHGTIWHIDHVIPLAEFELAKESQRKKAMRYTNLQPLWGPDNIRKSDKVAEQQLLAL